MPGATGDLFANVQRGSRAVVLPVAQLSKKRAASIPNNNGLR